MRQSTLFTKTRKETPSDEVSLNAGLLIRGGFVRKEMAGVYAMLPLGMRVISNIEQIVREEMNAIDGQEVKLTALQERELWETTRRWDDEVADLWFKTALKNNTLLGLAWSHEEPMTRMVKEYINSYRDLPVAIYQFQTKFRNELRAKSGLMRGREFLMKDLYSFHTNEEDRATYYEQVKGAYEKIFDRAGIGEETYFTFASGGVFADFSHEFQTVTDAGEDTIYIHPEKGIAINEEVKNEKVLSDMEIDESDLVKRTAVEVGNIFNLGTRFSNALDLAFTDEEGNATPVVMGSYGIGLGRLMGTIVEVLSDENGIVWPEEVAPFRVHIIEIGENEEVKREAETIYNELTSAGVDVLYDDRDLRPGEKFADSDLLGIPTRLVISDKTVESKKVEVKKRNAENPEFIARENIVSYVTEPTN